MEQFITDDDLAGLFAELDAIEEVLEEADEDEADDAEAEEDEEMAASTRRYEEIIRKHQND